MADYVIRRFDTPDETRRFERGHLDLIRIAGTTLGRARYEPGWKWSKHVAPVVGTRSCQVAHLGLVLEGRAMVRMDDGREFELKPGDIFHIAPGHDSWVLGDPAGRTIFQDWWEAAGADASGIPFLAYERPGRLTARGERAARDFETEYRREPSFVALEGYDAILVLEAGARAAGSVDPAAVCHALRHTAVQGTRGTIAFSTEPAGVVHQQWKWAPTCVVVFRAGRQRFSSSELLWDAERSSPRPMESG